MQNNIANYGMLTSAGGFEQQQGQNDINAQLAKFNQAFQYPQQQLGMMESSLGMTPYDTGSSGTSASTTTQTQSNPMAMALGGMQTLGGLARRLLAGRARCRGSVVFSGFSDRRLKTDIQKVGTHSTGLPIYAYRYKGDPKSYPKVAGPMAEDVMKIAPHAVRPMTTKGHMAVHMPTLDALGAGATPPSSPGVGRAIGALGKRQGPLQPGVATPPSRSIVGRMPILGALGVADNPYAPSPLGGAPPPPPPSTYAPSRLGGVVPSATTGYALPPQPAPSTGVYKPSLMDIIAHVETGDRNITQSLGTKDINNNWGRGGGDPAKGNFQIIDPTYQPRRDQGWHRCQQIPDCDTCSPPSEQARVASFIPTSQWGRERPRPPSGRVYPNYDFSKPPPLDYHG